MKTRKLPAVVAGFIFPGFLNGSFASLWMTVKRRGELLVSMDS